MLHKNLIFNVKRVRKLLVFQNMPYFRLRTKMSEEVNQLMQKYDVVVTSTFDVNQLQITNLTGHPVVVMPNGFVDGRPMSITFLGNLFDEATILGLAKAYQDATDFDEKHPELFKN